jgi:hypothetical protein
MTDNQFLWQGTNEDSGVTLDPSSLSLKAYRSKTIFTAENQNFH